MAGRNTDILVVGGGLGGVAAALAGLRSGKRVVLTEEHRWLGGQLTSQAVPVDEHTWVEQFGATAAYRQLRIGIRRFYRSWYPLTERAKALPNLNPGAGYVSPLCAEPRVAVAVIEAMLAPHLASGRLTVLTDHRPVDAAVEAGTITSVQLQHLQSGDLVEVGARYVLDATELGDLLPLTGTEYVTGFESQAETGEPSAPRKPQPANQQSFSWCFAFDHVEGDHRIDMPESYGYWKSYEPPFWGGPLLSLTAPDPRTLEPFTRTFTPTIDDDPYLVRADQRANPGGQELWTFRRILARKLFQTGALSSDVVVANWPMIDYLEGNLIDVGEQEREHHERQARELSLSMFYWLQTEAPRPDGGTGWPGLRLRGDVTGTSDGLAMAPYIRESRRIKAVFTVTENHLSMAAKGSGEPAEFTDTVGLGMYRIDLHPSSGGDNYIDVPTRPFEIPLGALIPVATENLIAAAKNIGTTHITSGAYRVHPVEWNVGEAAGALAAFCLDRRTTPRRVRDDPRHLTDFQTSLEEQGIELHWPDVTGY